MTSTTPPTEPPPAQDEQERIDAFFAEGLSIIAAAFYPGTEGSR